MPLPMTWGTIDVVGAAAGAEESAGAGAATVTVSEVGKRPVVGPFRGEGLSKV